MKFPRLLAGLGLVVLTGIAGTACTTHAGAAAQVGSSTIETATVRAMVDRGMAAIETVPAEQAMQAPDRVTLQGRTITALIDIELLQSVAEREGVTVSDQDVAAYYQALAILQAGSVQEFESGLAALGYAKEDLDLVARSGALHSAIADKVAPDLITPISVARDRYEASVAQFGKLPLTFEVAGPYLQRFLVFDERNAKVVPLLRAAAAREHVSVNPRFGAWDQESLAVDSSTDVAPGTIATTEAPVPASDQTLRF